MAPGDKERPTNQGKLGALGQGNHEVSPGECVESIAFETGHYWRYLWEEHGKNAELRKARDDNGNALLPGDRLDVPPIEPAEFERPTTQHHKFKRLGVPSELHVQVRFDGEPLDDQPYTLVVDGRETTGRTDGRGMIHAKIAPDAATANLVVGPEGSERKYHLRLGHLRPATETRGVVGRLHNLGYPYLRDGDAETHAVEALQTFQAMAHRSVDKLDEDIDETTRRDVKAEHET